MRRPRRTDGYAPVGDWRSSATAVPPRSSPRTGHAVALAEQGKLPKDGRKRWESTQREIRDWIEERCRSEGHGAYVLHPGSDELDASVLLAARWGYHAPDEPRFQATLDAIRRELSAGPFLYRPRTTSACSRR